MQRFIWLAALLVVLTVTQLGSAQFVAQANNGRSNRPTTSAASGGLSNTFRLSNFFPNFSSIKPTRGPVYSTLPKPGTPDYLKAFGYKRLY
jgi:hypothetical protein